MHSPEKKVTFVLTSCNRFDLLGPTLKSFFEYNTYPIEEYIIIEDSPNVQKLKKVLSKFKDVNFTVLYNDPQMGQLPSIDKAYSEVKTGYIFHCEDDWQFYKPGFIEKSFSVLDHNEKIVSVWLRGLHDTNRHPVEPEIFKCADDTHYRLMATHYLEVCHGFTFNPGLRRTSDYELIKPFSKWAHEGDLSDEYYRLGFRGATLLDGYVRHLGNHRKIRYRIDEKQWVKELMHIKKRMGAAICKALGI